MFYFRGFSIVGVLAISGLFSAIIGFISYNFIVPYVVSINVDKVSLERHFLHVSVHNLLSNKM